MLLGWVRGFIQRALYNLAECFELGNKSFLFWKIPKDQGKAKTIYRVLSWTGFLEAQIGYAYLLLDGTPTERDLAFLIFTALATGSKTEFSSDVMANLGCWYSENKQYEEANRWYELAANEGNAIAQFSLGQAYLHGFGIEKDAKKAMLWFHRAQEELKTTPDWYDNFGPEDVARQLALLD